MFANVPPPRSSQSIRLIFSDLIDPAAILLLHNEQDSWQNARGKLFEALRAANVQDARPLVRLNPADIQQQFSSTGAAPNSALTFRLDIGPGTTTDEALRILQAHGVLQGEAEQMDDELDSEARFPATVPAEVEEIREYASRCARRSPAVATALEGFATRVAQVSRGDVPAGSANQLVGLSPEIVGRAVANRSTLSFLETLRNFLIFMPVLWTWFELSRATHAYGQLTPEQQARPFIALWQEGFQPNQDPSVLSLTATALSAVVLLIILIGTTTLLSILRARNERIQRVTADNFASLLSRAAGLQSGVEARTSEEHLREFARAGLHLTATLSDLTVAFRESGGPLASSVQTAERMLREMTTVATRNAEQLSDITASLNSIAHTGPALERSAVSLAQIEQVIGPSSDRLATAVEGLEDHARKLGQATDNFVEALSTLDRGTEAFVQATEGMNLVAGRLMEETGIRR